MPCTPTLRELLFDYANANDAESRAGVEKRVWDSFGIIGAVFVLDMAGFSRTTRDWGIVYYLAMIERMQITVKPIIEQYGGEVVKFEADNCYARFPQVPNAIEASIGINTAIEAINRTTPKAVDIAVACGIDYGRYLLVDDKDFWGPPVNRASKLGEDIGVSGEILVGHDAEEQIEDKDRFRFEPVSHSVSGILLDAYRVLY